MSDKKQTSSPADEERAALEEYVSVRLFKDGGRYSRDVFVAVNGEGCLIKRGENVRVKRKFVRVLEQADAQDRKTAGMMEAAERDCERMSREM